ncbi:EthD family reductase [Leucobacter sp. wl10]|uniref:EthD family reductase n=1 Tax=Leucobacter sp. wl10 TaxID=2304677 RepID=UPI000E5AC97D|nr:EthD family reductase [Leucobacter sp. wl10]RGE20010.1 EthD family reductase [Leucobacter sp. wl10]
MHQLTVLYPEPTDRAAFREHYLSTHLPLCAKLPGVQGIAYALDICEPGEGPYFGVFQATFADEAALGAALASPEGLTVQADVPNYATGGATVLPFAVESFPVG